MPEIRNETPSDQELLDYFHQYATQHFPALQGLRPGLFQCNQFLEKAGGAIRDSLQRLNKLPRTDSFWQNTNKRPTVFKLHEFCQFVLRNDPSDELALHTLVALCVLLGANDFGQEYLNRLYQLGAVDLNPIICAAMHLELSTGVPSGRRLADVLHELDAVQPAQLILKGYCESDLKEAALWSKAALSMF
jgi:hypothetical protein